MNAPKKATGKPRAAKKADLKPKAHAKIIRTTMIPKTPVLTIDL